MRAIQVPKAVLRKATALGAPGHRWLEELPSLVASFEREWRIEVGATIAGGSGGFVAEAVTADGVDAVLKLAIPEGLEGQGSFARELSTVRDAHGRGYVGLLNSDADRRAMLQERLGRSLGQLGLPVETQIDIIAATLRQTWRPPLEMRAVWTGRDQARELALDVVSQWELLGRPCPSSTVEQAVGYAHARRDAFDLETSVWIHGDAHPANILEAVPGGGPGGAFKLVDPDGMLSTPAHDLAIPLRDWSDELLAGDAVGLTLAWCAQLSERTGVDGQAIWQWAFLERVSTGLFMGRLGDPYGEKLLTVATRLTGTDPTAPDLRSAR